MLLLAQSEAAAWGGIIAAVANMGFAAVVGWYLLTKAIPQLQKDFKSELKAEREHADKLDGTRRVEGKESLQLVIQHCEREAIRRDEIQKVEMGIVNRSLVAQGEVLEEVRDALKAHNEQRHTP